MELEKDDGGGKRGGGEECGRGGTGDAGDPRIDLKAAISSRKS